MEGETGRRGKEKEEITDEGNRKEEIEETEKREE